MSSTRTPVRCCTSFDADPIERECTRSRSAEEGLAFGAHERQGHGAHLQGSEHPHRELKLGVWIPDADARRRRGDVVLPDRGVREKSTSKYFSSEWSRGAVQTSLHRALPRHLPRRRPRFMHHHQRARRILSPHLRPHRGRTHVPRRAFRLFSSRPAPPPPPSPNSLHPRVHPRLISRDRFIKSSIIIIIIIVITKPTDRDPRASPASRRAPTTSPTPPNTPLYPHHIMDVDAPNAMHPHAVADAIHAHLARAPPPASSPADSPRRRLPRVVVVPLLRARALSSSSVTSCARRSPRVRTGARRWRCARETRPRACPRPRDPGAATGDVWVRR